MSQSKKVWSENTSLMLPPPKIRNAKFVPIFLISKNWQIFEFASVRPGPLIFQFQIDPQIDRPTNPLVPQLY